MKNLPTISIVTCSYNSDLRIYKKMLDGIKNQKYPKSLIEHIVMEAGSTNGAIELIRKYKTKLYVRKDLVDKALVRMSLGIRLSKGELVLLLEPDNIMTDDTWLYKMVRPFIENKEIICSFSEYNSYESDMPVLTKYFALMGINDPLVFYLGKSEKLPRYKKYFDRSLVVAENTGYTTLRYNSENLPTLGDNGHMVRRTIINRVNKKPERFLHTDAFALLANKGMVTYAAVHNSIIHYTGASIIDYFKRRVKYKSQFYDNQRGKREYLVYDSNSIKDKKNLLLFIFYSLTWVQPILVSVRGFLDEQDAAWFIHPLVCFLTVFAYGYSEVLSNYWHVANHLKR